MSSALRGLSNLGRGIGKLSKVAVKVGAKGAKLGAKGAKRFAKTGAKFSKRLAKTGLKGSKKIASKIKANPKLAAKLAIGGTASALVVNALVQGRNLDIEFIKNENGKILVKTQKRHNIQKGEEVTISKTNSEPTIDGDYDIMDIKNENEFYLTGTITKDGTSGIINKDYTAKELVTDGVVDSAEIAGELIKEVADVATDVGSNIGADLFGNILKSIGINMEVLQMLGIGTSLSSILSIITLLILKFS